jgi:TfoX/Sxy family transcriptional regulator of competence genes
MAYDEGVAERVRKVLRRRKDVTERKMFGGLAFLLNGNMCCGVVGKDLCLRLGNDGAAEALKERHTREMDFTGKPLRSMVYVRPAGIKADDDLKSWVKRAVTFTKSLPPK